MSDIESANWDPVAANNNATPPAGFPVGIAPSAVGGSEREARAALKRDWNRTHTTIASTGSANAYVLTFTGAPASYINGQRFSFKANFANTGAATANVNTLGAVTIVKQSVTGQIDLVANDIVSTQHVSLEYDSGTTKFVLLNPQAPSATDNIGGGVRAVTGTTDTILTGDHGKLVTYSNASSIAVTLPQATGSFTTPFYFAAQNIAAGVVTITPTTSTIDGFASISLKHNEGLRVYSDGTNYFTNRGRQHLAQGYITGLTLSNAADTAHDITVAAGSARDSLDVFDLVLASAMTKQIDATWAAGTAAGGFFTGSTALAANVSYHVLLIRKTTDGSIDAGFDSDPAGSHIPAGYVALRRLGSVKQDAGNTTLLQFNQYGDDFILKTPIIDVDATNPGTSAVDRVLSVPAGVQMRARIFAGHFTGTTSNAAAYFSSKDQTDSTVTTPGTGALANLMNAGSPSASTAFWHLNELNIWTDTAATIRSRLSASGAADHIGVITNGWMDTRGK